MAVEFVEKTYIREDTYKISEIGKEKYLEIIESLNSYDCKYYEEPMLIEAVRNFYFIYKDIFKQTIHKLKMKFYKES